MKRSKIFAAALVVALLSSMLSPFALSASASLNGSVSSDVVLGFGAPDVIQVRVNENHHPLCPCGSSGCGTGVYRPFNPDREFWAPFGTPGVDFDLGGGDPYLPSTEFGRGWLRSGTALGSVTRGAWGDAWGPWATPSGALAPFAHFAARCEMPDDPTATEVFRFDGWRSAASGGSAITRTTVLNNNTALYGQWTIMREVRIRHEFDGAAAPFINWQNPIEFLPNGNRQVPVGSTLNLGTHTTNLHLQFLGSNFFLFSHWDVATGPSRTFQPASYLDSDLGPFSVLNIHQTIRIPEQTNFTNFAAGRLYLIANWTVIGPGTGVWTPPTRPEGEGEGGPSGGGGPGGGGGAGGGQQTSPPAGGGGVIGGGVGAGLGPGAAGAVGPDGQPLPSDEVPYYTETPETGGAPLIPITTTFPAVVPPPSAVAPLPTPFTPAPIPEAVVLEIPAITIPVVGFDSNTWALMNLILAIVGAIGAVLTVLHVWRKNRQRGDEAQMSRDEEESRKRRKQWLLAVGLVSLVSCVLFPLTQDITNRMTLLDVWTIAHILLFAAQGVATWQILNRKESRDGDGGGIDMAQAGA